MGVHHPNWKRRFELPDRSIKEAADQFEEARGLLWKHLEPGAGLPAPALNLAAIAIELYLKSLSARLVHSPSDFVDGVHVVTSVAEQHGHKFSDLFDAISEDIRLGLGNSFSLYWPWKAGVTLRDVLEGMNGMLEASRYWFEQGQDVSRYSLREVEWMSRFLAGFVSDLSPTEWIEWKS